MESSTVIANLIDRAAKGEAAAGDAILTKLASANPDEQLAILRALHRVADTALWRYLLEYLAAGSWGGTPLDSAQNGSVRWQQLQPKIRALFLTASDGQPAGLQALMSGVASQDEKISRVAIDLAGLSHDADALKPLVKVLQEGRGHARLQAARALGNLGDARAVPALIKELYSDDELVAALAKDSLVSIGSPALEALTSVLDDEHASGQARWMAARALVRIGDARAIPTLVTHLSDSNYGIRWLAADGLIGLGSAGIRAVLHQLTMQPITPWLADSAAHVLQHAQPHAAKEILKPVIEALHSVDAEWSAPTAAQRAAEELATKGLIKMPSA